MSLRVNYGKFYCALPCSGEKESAFKRRFEVLYQGKQSQLEFAVEPIEEPKQLLQLSVTEFRGHLSG